MYYNCRVSGNINGVAIQEQELHCYIVTADGRTYTAISRIAPDIGWDIQVCLVPNPRGGTGTGGGQTALNLKFSSRGKDSSTCLRACVSRSQGADPLPPSSTCSEDR